MKQNTHKDSDVRSSASNRPSQHSVTGEIPSHLRWLADRLTDAILSKPWLDRDAWLEQFDAVKRERDELLAAAIALVRRSKCFNDDLTETVVADDMRKLREIIAKSEGLAVRASQASTLSPSTENKD